MSHDDLLLSSLALAPCNIFEYGVVFNLIVTVGLDFGGDSVQRVFQRFLGGGIGHARLQPAWLVA